MSTLFASGIIEQIKKGAVIVALCIALAGPAWAQCRANDAINCQASIRAAQQSLSQCVVENPDTWTTTCQTQVSEFQRVCTDERPYAPFGNLFDRQEASQNCTTQAQQIIGMAQQQALQRKAQEAAEQAQIQKRAEEESKAREAQAAKLKKAIAQQESDDEAQGYKRIGFDDFALDGKAMAEAHTKVSMTGTYVKYGDAEYLTQNALASARLNEAGDVGESVALLTDDADRGTRKYFLDCRKSNQAMAIGCDVTVLGHVTMCMKTALLNNASNLPCLVVDSGWWISSDAIQSDHAALTEQNKDAFIASAKQSCIAREVNDPSMTQSGYTEAQIGLYCQCTAEKAADAITPDEMQYIATNRKIPPSFTAKTKLIALTCRSVTLPAPASAPAQPLPRSVAAPQATPDVRATKTRWYVAHMGAETCVPLDDIGPDGNRLYYGTGTMQTPEDFKQFFREQGGLVGPPPMPDQTGMVAFKVSFSNGTDTIVVLFDDADSCKSVMSKMENSR